MIGCLSFQLHGLKAKQSTRFVRVVTYIMRGLVLTIIPVGYSVPSVSIYYTVYTVQ